MTVSDKSHETGLRIMEVFKILLEEDADKQTIINKLKTNDNIGNVYTNEVYLKYFNTFEALGLDIEKTANGFSLKKALINIDLSQNEEKVLKKLIQSIHKLNNKNKEEIAKKLILKINKYVEPDLKKTLTTPKNNLFTNNNEINMVNMLKQIMEEGSEVNITYLKHNKEENMEVVIKKIFEEKGHYYICCYNSGMIRSRRICINSIISLKRSPKQASKIEPESTVIFEVYGRLAKSYKLKSWETLETFGDGYTRIINKKEDLETLMHRLLKYGENCKIIKPDNIIQEFTYLTNDILKNLEENICQE